MKNSLIVVSMVLIWAAHSGTASAQGSSDSSLAYTCALACEQQLGASCHDEQALTACLEQRPECGGDQELVRMARAFMDGRTTCPQPSSPTVVPAPAPTPRPRPRVRPRRQVQQAVVAPAQTAPEPAATGPEVDQSGLTYVIPALPILGEGPPATGARARLAQQTCEALGGVWYAEGRTADPSRERIVALIQHLVVPNDGPGGSPDDDRNPGVCLTAEGVVFTEVIREVLSQMRTGHAEQALQIDELRIQLEDLRALRQELEDLRARVALNDANANERDLMLSQAISRWARLFARERAQNRCRPGQATVEFIWDGQTEVVPCQTPEARMRAAASGDDMVAASEPSGEGRQRVQIPGRRRGVASASSSRLLTGERLGMIVESVFSTSHYRLVAHAGSHSPKFFGIGLGLTIRLVDHLYLAGVVDAGVGLRDGEHVPALAQVHYRFGVLGVAANHFLLGASAHFGHRYSGNGELAEQNGTWYQLRQRGLRLEAGYLWRERGWSPFVTVGAMLGVGCHADRRLSAGEDCVFDPGVFITFGGMRLRAP